MLASLIVLDYIVYYQPTNPIFIIFFQIIPKFGFAAFLIRLDAKLLFTDFTHSIVVVIHAVYCTLLLSYMSYIAHYCSHTCGILHIIVVIHIVHVY